MRILAFDQSITNTGFALYDAPGDERAIHCGSFSCDNFSTAEAQCDQFAKEVKSILGRCKKIDEPVDFIGWERASRKITAYRKKDGQGLLPKDGIPRWTVNASQLLLPEIQGCIRGIAISYSLPFESVGSDTWRAAIYGTGGGSLHRAAAKAAAKQYCRRLGITFANEDEAEAACIAIWMSRCSQRFRMLRLNKAKAAA